MGARALRRGDRRLRGRRRDRGARADAGRRAGVRAREGPVARSIQLRRRRAAIRGSELHRGGPADRAADVPQHGRGRRAPVRRPGARDQPLRRRRHGSLRRRLVPAAPRGLHGALVLGVAPGRRDRRLADLLRGSAALLQQGRAADRRGGRPAAGGRAPRRAGRRRRVARRPVSDAGPPAELRRQAVRGRGHDAGPAPLPDPGRDQQPRTGRPPRLLVLRVLLEPRLPDRGQERHACDRHCARRRRRAASTCAPIHTSTGSS